MSLSRDAISRLEKHFSQMANSYSINASAIASGFNPNGEVIPKFFSQGLLAVSSSEAHPLNDINIVMVEDRQGEGFLDTGGNPCTGRTNTDTTDRETHSLVGKPSKYETKETQCDVHIPFGIINKWAVAAGSKQYSNNVQNSFSQKYSKFVQERVALDSLNIGFNGMYAAASTTPGSKLTDVNKGWIAVVKEQMPAQVIDSALTVGSGVSASYKNLDAAVADLLDICITSSHRHGLVCIISDNLIADERNRVYNNVDFIPEKKNTSDTFSHFGGLDRVVVPNFPDNTIVVTSLSNLSIYIKESTTYRQITSNHKRNRVEDYQHREEAYIVENMEKFAAITNLTPFEVVE